MSSVHLCRVCHVECFLRRVGQLGFAVSSVCLSRVCRVLVFDRLWFVMSSVRVSSV